MIAATTRRAQAEDCVVFSARYNGYKIESLPSGCILGSSSVRRVAQLKRLFPHLAFKDIRGNLQTRLQKLDSGEYDALILAVAGLSRLGLQQRIGQTLPSDLCLHAVGQGALGVVCREEDQDLVSLLQRTVHDVPTQLCCDAERAFLRETEGGCQVPVGVQTIFAASGELTLHGVISNLDGSKFVKGEISGDARDATALGTKLAVKLKKDGGDEVLKEVVVQAQQ